MVWGKESPDSQGSAPRYRGRGRQNKGLRVRDGQCHRKETTSLMKRGKGEKAR